MILFFKKLYARLVGRPLVLIEHTNLGEVQSRVLLKNESGELFCIYNISHWQSTIVKFDRDLNPVSSKYRAAILYSPIDKTIEAAIARSEKLEKYLDNMFNK